MPRINRLLSEFDLKTKHAQITILANISYGIFFLYIMLDIIITLHPLCKYNILIMSRKIVEFGINFDIICKKFLSTIYILSSLSPNDSHDFIKITFPNIDTKSSLYFIRLHISTLLPFVTIYIQSYRHWLLGGNELYL